MCDGGGNAVKAFGGSWVSKTESVGKVGIVSESTQWKHEHNKSVVQACTHMGRGTYNEDMR